MTSDPLKRLPSVLIIAGQLIVDAVERDSYVAECADVVRAARAATGCLDFSVTADTVDPTRVCIYERWDGEANLLAFRGSGPSDSQASSIVEADVKRYEIASVGDP